MAVRWISSTTSRWSTRTEATSLQLNLDQGPFGTRSNAQARTLVQNAIGLWNGVGTATMRLAIGTSLSTDYNATNYAGILNSYSDGINPVIFDTDGTLTDAIFGVGAKSSILGFAGSAYYTSGASAGKYAEGKAVLNGALNVSDGVWTIVLAHEFGHFFGLDHSQIDNMQGVAPSNFVLMYPIAYRTLVSLHEDDVAAVTSLYPSASAASVYGQLQGTFTTAGGTPIVGANIWARENVTRKGLQRRFRLPHAGQRLFPPVPSRRHLYAEGRVHRRRLLPADRGSGRMRTHRATARSSRRTRSRRWLWAARRRSRS